MPGGQLSAGPPAPACETERVRYGNDRPTPAFAGAALDRAAELRSTPDRFPELLERPGARAVAAYADGVLLDGDALARSPLGDGHVGTLVRAAGPILLGLEAGAPLFAVDLEELAPGDRAAAVPGSEAVSLRDAGARLEQTEGGLAAYLVALLNWHRRHRFCANCGNPTSVDQAGLARACASCGASHFPRIDPVVIMTVEHDDRLLLGRRAGWPAGRFSVLAGFVAPGETPEEAVVREVREESGIEAAAPRYVTSQPWPFPSSLMLGFAARSVGGEPTAGDGELAEIGWFTRAQVQAAAAWTGEGPLLLPPPISIARLLIDAWLANGRS
jgi:NAD+ diphosphatase